MQIRILNLGVYKSQYLIPIVNLATSGILPLHLWSRCTQPVCGTAQVRWRLGGAGVEDHLRRELLPARRPGQVDHGVCPSLRCCVGIRGYPCVLLYPTLFLIYTISSVRNPDLLYIAVPVHCNPGANGATYGVLGRKIETRAVMLVYRYFCNSI